MCLPLLYQKSIVFDADKTRPLFINPLNYKFMVKNPSKSISGLKYFNKIVLVLGISCMLLQGIFPLTAYAAINSDELQQRTVTGRVVDVSNNPMPGVNVLEKNTTNGGQTGADGSYSISVPARSVLSF